MYHALSEYHALSRCKKGRFLRPAILYVKATTCLLQKVVYAEILRPRRKQNAISKTNMPYSKNRFDLHKFINEMIASGKNLRRSTKYKASKWPPTPLTKQRPGHTLRLLAMPRYLKFSRRGYRSTQFLRSIHGKKSTQQLSLFQASRGWRLASQLLDFNVPMVPLPDPLIGSTSEMDLDGCLRIKRRQLDHLKGRDPSPHLAATSEEPRATRRQACIDNHHRLWADTCLS